jgi:class 3 adenylate cyclase
LKPPKTNYVSVGDALVAYQVVGEGKLDLVCSPGFSSLQAFWEHPLVVRFYEGLADFSRLILFAPRGWGESDRLSADRLPTWEDWAEDLHAVADAADSKRMAIFAWGFGSTLSMIFAATYPERISGMVFFDCTAKWIADESYPWGFPTAEAAEEVAQIMEQMWGSEEYVAAVIPSVANDDRFKTWMASTQRVGASPRMVAAQFRQQLAFDARALLPLIQAPTLVLHRKDSQFYYAQHGRYLVDHIKDARLVAVPGSDEVPFTEGVDQILGLTEEFLTGARRPPEPDRILATVLFSDIVDSTSQAAEMGDTKWKQILDMHDSISREVVDAHRGRWVKHTGDGLLATFDGPARAVRAAMTLHSELEAIEIRIRVGVHTGEVELRGEDDIGGIAVHMGARICATAGAGEVLVSRTVVDLVAGSGLDFEDRGAHVLKGVPGEYRLFGVRP